jgi:cytochrome c oxidase assembly protein subunit 15
MNRVSPKAIANWLFGVAFLVFAIVVVGGITRLTESGLSITEWKPVSGVIPPLNEAQWLAEFEKYRRIPEYQLINKGMSLDEFKFIYFWEWIHRQLGRVIGLALALPWAWLAVRNRLPDGYRPRIFGLVMLIGFQGALGWWMVASGLETRTDVSHFRLSAHLLTALLILAGLVWTALDLKALARDPAARPARLTGLSIAVALILFVQLLFGAWVAGLNAGLAASDWPLMNGRFFPTETLGANFWHNLANDPHLLHWVHRWWAFVAVAAFVVLARRAKAAGNRPGSIALHTAFGVQILLGIATVMTQVNIVVAVLHQATGALVVASTVWCMHAVGKR